MQDTIVAASSPPGRSLRAILRLSGPDVLAIAGELIAKPDDAIEGLAFFPSPRRLIPCRLALGEGQLPVLLSYFASPQSHTSQDMLELQLPGNPALLERLIARCVSLGARLAAPGEFTFRAFVAGKLDLTQAEGVAATIAAVGDGELQAAQRLKEGELGQWAQRMVDALATALALVEAGIDFTDQEDVTPIAPDALLARLRGLKADLETLLKSSRSWASVHALPRAVLLGLPSAGKSTLFNALVGYQRAVVAQEPGTTRDLLCEPVTLQDQAAGSTEVLLVDMAGLDEPRTALDEQVQQAVRKALREADLVLLVRDPLQPARPLEDWLRLTSAPVLRIATKADLANSKALAGESCELRVSSHTGEGLGELRAMMLQALGSRGRSVQADALALQPRHELALRNATARLAEALAPLQPQEGSPVLRSAELVAQPMREALDELAGLGGQVSPDDVIGRIFATFCIGK